MASDALSACPRHQLAAHVRGDVDVVPAPKRRVLSEWFRVEHVEVGRRQRAGVLGRGKGNGEATNRSNQRGNCLLAVHEERTLPRIS